MAKVNIFNPEWVEMVFEGKNHSYGAYVLRKESSNRHLKAMIIAGTVFVGGIVGPGLIKSLIPKKKVEQDLTVRTLTDIKLDQPNKADDIVREVAPPPPPMRNTIKFTPPVIKPDAEVREEDEPISQKEAVETKTAIGVTNFDKGTDDIEAPIAQVEQTVTEEVKEEEPFLIVEQMPEFPGGQAAMMKFLRDNIVYPVIAQENGIQGTVYLRFVIDKNGKVSKITVVRSLHKSCDAEAIRVVQAMPSWKPGRQGGREVPVSYTLPVRFALQ